MTDCLPYVTRSAILVLVALRYNVIVRKRDFNRLHKLNMAMELIGSLRTFKLINRNAYFTLTSVLIVFEYLFYVHQISIVTYFQCKHK